MIKSPCVKDCPNRCMECRLTCEAYKVYRAAKDEDYAKRARHVAELPGSPDKAQKARQKSRRKMAGRK